MPSYFYEENGIIKESLLTDRAESWARSFIKPEQPTEKGKKNPKLTSAQLRKFHIEAKELEERTKNLQEPNKDEGFKKLRPLVKMLKSKVAYACPDTGKGRKVPEEFRKYIEEMVNNVENLEDFKAFALCFESVVGFFYGLGGKSDEAQGI